MSIAARNLPLQEIKQTPQIPASKIDTNKLSKEELELLLVLIKRSQFLGEHVEVIYNMVVKIQNQYLEGSK
jgi:hypothetical protein